MLTGIIIEKEVPFSALPNWAEYVNVLARLGYFSRKSAWAQWDAATSRVVCCAELASDDAWEQSESREEVQKCMPQRDEPIKVRKFSLALSEDDSYCVHEHWDKLNLCGDVLFGVSPIRHAGCGGFVPRYRLQLATELEARLWDWDLHFDHVYSLWLTSGMYEEWASEELVNPTSALNAAGASLAQDLQNTLRVEVVYNAKAPYRADG